RRVVGSPRDVTGGFTSGRTGQQARHRGNEESLRYYDVRRKWTRRIEPHLGDAELNRVLVQDFGMFTWGTRGYHFLLGQTPFQYENSDGNASPRGKNPRFFG